LNSFEGPIGLYVLETDVTKYPNDTGVNTRISFNIKARDGSILSKSSRYDYSGAEKDGVKRHKKLELDVLKPIATLDGWLLDTSSGASLRYAKAENNMISINPIDDKFYPYIPEQSLTFPYTLRGIPVSSGGNYTDESGQQWVCDTLEVNADGTGKLVQRVKYESLAEYIDSTP